MVSDPVTFVQLNNLAMLIGQLFLVLEVRLVTLHAKIRPLTDYELST